MALDKASLITAIKAAQVAQIGVDDDGQTFAEELADAIDTFVKSGTVNTAGLLDDAGDALLLDTTIS